MSASQTANGRAGVPNLVRHTFALLLLAAAALYVLLFFGLTGVGVIGPDEPRYAAIGREMAASGDWITPRLWGEPWFEKPALIYWMAGLGFSAGLGPELAPRLPVAVLSAAFLVFFHWVIGREFNARAALFSTTLLATSAAWMAFSQVGVTDLPMAAAFSAAMLLSLRWLEQGDRRGISAAAALFGIAVLAKGLVPLVLALPLVWFGRRHLRDWLRPVPVAAFLVAAAPWYVICYYRNGWPFFDDFFLKHHLSRFSSEALQHQQPFWFYLPVLLAGLFPWTPLLGLIKPRFSDIRERFLAAWVLFGFIFFSASTNKLPGYLLPLVPALATLLGLALDRAKRARAALAFSALLLVTVPVIAGILPDAMARGITRANPAGISWPMAVAAPVLAAFAWQAETRKRRVFAFGVVAAAMVAATAWLKIETFPALDRAASARPFWRQIEAKAGEICVEKMHRSWRYNLNYYSVTPLPDCADEPRRFRVIQDGGRPPALVEAQTATSSSPSRSWR